MRVRERMISKSASLGNALQKHRRHYPAHWDALVAPVQAGANLICGHINSLFVFIRTIHTPKTKPKRKRTAAFSPHPHGYRFYENALKRYFTRRFFTTVA